MKLSWAISHFRKGKHRGQLGEGQISSRLLRSWTIILNSPANHFSMSDIENIDALTIGTDLKQAHCKVTVTAVREVSFIHMKWRLKSVV